MLNKQNFILCLCSVVLCFYVFEAYLYFSHAGLYSKFSVNRSKRVQAAISQGIDFDTRTRLEFIKDSQISGSDAVLRISPLSFASSNGLPNGSANIYPLAGIANKSTVYCNIYGDYLIFQSDDWGFRNPEKSYPVDSLDIAIVGDSFAMGHCEEDDVASLLRQRGFSVANFSYSGNGPLIELASLREYASRFKPRVLLWLYYEGNDLSNLKRERQSEILKSYLDVGYTQNLADKQPILNDLLKLYSERTQAKKELEELKRHQWRMPAMLAGTIDLVKKSVFQLIPRTRQSNASQLPLLEQALLRAKLDTAKWGGKVIFIYLPEWRRLAQKQLSITALQRNQVLSIADKLGISVIDLTEEMSSAKKPLTYFPFESNGHYNAKGYALLVDRITQELIKDRP